MKLYIKNMVCNRCILVVKQELEKLNLQTAQVTMGEVELAKVPSAQQLQQIDTRLKELGFELLDDKKENK